MILKGIYLDFIAFYFTATVQTDLRLKINLGIMTIDIYTMAIILLLKAGISFILSHCCTVATNK